MRKHRKPYYGDFTCSHCRNYVSAEKVVCGVNNRNHCPYCLHSRHVDLYEAGDRLSACKAPMAPVGLSLKISNGKYKGSFEGELMLIHCCEDCGKISINRIAADDIAEYIYEIFKHSLKLGRQTQEQLEMNGIQLLQRMDEAIVRARLFGRVYG